MRSVPVALGGRTLSARDELRSERALARGRVLLATAVLPAALVEAHVDGPKLLIQLAAGGYLMAAGVIAVLLQFSVFRTSVLAAAGHVSDLGNVAATMVLMGAGPALALVTGFTLLGAAFRWGLMATLVTALGLAAVQFTQMFVTPLVAADSTLAAAITGDALVARAAYFLVGGVLLGYLVQSDRQLRIEAATVADVASRVEVRRGLSQAIAIATDALLRVFKAERGIVVVHDTESGRLTRWDSSQLAQPSASDAVRVTELDVSSVGTYLSTPAGTALHVVRRGQAGERLDVVSLDGNSAPVPDALVTELGSFEQVLALGVEMPGKWTGRVFLIDPRVSRDRAGTLAWAQRLVRRLVPAVYNVYLLRRVRTRSVAEERARMARELHDTVVQSVLGVQVQLHALAVDANGVPRELADDLTRLGLTLREEVLRLREMMRHMQPVNPTPDQLMDAIAAIVHRFETETGIRTRFITRADQVPLLPAACLEVMRIVQEALVNIRRHSGARNVFVRFAVEEHVCRLSVEDDGGGFPFEGRLSLPELDSRHQGPWVIKDRVRRLGGQIIVESAPGRGSRVEICFPVTTYALQ